MYHIDSIDCSEIYQDVLNEIGNIGASNAATALSQMLNTVIRVSVTKVRLASIDEATEYVNSDNASLSGALLNIVGSIQGKMMFLLRSDSVDSLVSALMGGMDASMIPPEMKDSALQEVGNIVTASYINSLSVLTGLMIDESVPTIVHGNFLDIVDHAHIEEQKLLLIQTKLSADSVTVTGSFVFIPHQSSFVVLLKALGVM